MPKSTRNLFLHLLLLGNIVFALASCRMRHGESKAFVDTQTTDTRACESDNSCEPHQKHETQIPASAFQQQAGGSLFIVAHQDDDLLFVNPDMIAAIQTGKPVRTIYMSSGEAGIPSPEYWQSREKGVEAAYAQMAGAANNWVTVPFAFGSKNIHLRQLVERSSVSLMFMRLPDGMVYGDGTAAYENKTIEKLWKGSISSIPSVDGAHSFTRDEVIDLLAQVMTSMAVDSIHSLDSSKELFSASDEREWFIHDNSDHIFAGYFAFVAQRKYSLPHRYRSYIGYSVEDHPENVPASAFAAKFAAVRAYAPYDSETCGSSCAESDLFGFWSKRKISSTAVSGTLKGRISVYDNSCMQPVGGASAAGTAIEIAACNTSAAQQWQLTEQGALVGIGNKCLQVKGAGIDGTAVELADCNQSEGQRWTLMTSAQLRGINNKCLDVKSGATADGSRLQILGCNGLAQQTMAFIFSPTAAKSPDAQFGNGDIGNNQNMADSFKFANLNHDSKPDACIVKADGVYCALMQGDGSFASYKKLSASVVNDASEYSATVMYGDINGDKSDDLCVRNSMGIACAEINGDASAFVNFSLRTVSGDFSDGGGWKSSSTRYQSIRLGDVNGDGKADICGRAASGIVCAVNNGSGSFGAATEWLSSSVAEAGEWQNAAFAASSQLADVNGDGRSDICFMANKGIYCALAKRSGDGFENYYRAGHSSDMVAGWQMSPTYYRSIRFPDVNGDGIADLCGRAAVGIICGLGLGDGYFDLARSITLKADFNDVGGWGNAIYAQSIQFGDINGDKHMDVCARGFFSILCAVAP